MWDTSTGQPDSVNTGNIEALFKTAASSKEA